MILIENNRNVVMLLQRNCFDYNNSTQAENLLHNTIHEEAYVYLILITALRTVSFVTVKSSFSMISSIVISDCCCFLLTI